MAGLLLGAASPAPPAPPESQAVEVLARLDRRLGAIESLRGRFVQTFVSSGLGVPQAERGTFALRRPDRLRCDYTDPEEKTAVSDGTSTWLYLPEEKVVYRGSVDEWRESSAFAVLAGGSLPEQYRAVSVSADGATRPGDVVLNLVPASPRDQFERLLLEFEPESLLLRVITAVDGMGNRVSMLLEDVEENPALPDGLFEFTPPRGTEVVDQSGAEAAGRAGPDG